MVLCYWLAAANRCHGKKLYTKIIFLSSFFYLSYGASLSQLTLCENENQTTCFGENFSIVKSLSGVWFQ